MEQLQNLIGGQLQGSKNGKWLDNIEPATGAVYGQIPRSDADDVELAVQAAAKAFPQWSTRSFEDRSECLRRWAKIVAQHADELVRAESKDNGKPISLAEAVDIPRAQKNLEFFAGAIEHFASEAHIPADSSHIHYTHRKPIGIVGCISPWNLPLYLFTWKIAPAIAAGNCVIAKPSEITPVSAFLLSQWAEEAGIPAGVFNVVHGLGSEAGQAIVQHPQIKAISFTGGTSTGAHIAQTTAPHFKKLSLELGGKNPAIIFEDCDFDKAVGTTLRSSFANQGQICLCGSRIFIEEEIYEDFKNSLINTVEEMKIGDPLDEETDLGALISKEHLKKIEYYANLAIEEGGVLLTGGVPCLPKDFENGNWIAPIIVEGLSYESRCSKEEIFGPMVTLHKFKEESELIKMVNNTRYGLAGSIWTKDVDRGRRLSESIETGMIWINTWLHRDLRVPFGGVKDSGIGREGGRWSLGFFSEAMNVCVKQE